VPFDRICHLAVLKVFKDKNSSRFYIRIFKQKNFAIKAASVGEKPYLSPVKGGGTLRE
jgi:hypothetical protein